MKYTPLYMSLLGTIGLTTLATRAPTEHGVINVATSDADKLNQNTMSLTGDTLVRA